ncbi:hypothetical protein ACQP0C_11095 [Nocardia sp. CA-129566]|uniref:hypothetical protein n=1 Tax=Nocardia sp. CA-129566 TaxID=3239976 RepID=UPI003D98C9A5
MVDVAAVSTPDDLRAALKMLFAHRHLSYDALIRKTNGNVGKTTLSDMVSGKTGLPRWDTVEQVLTACGIAGAELAVWEQAYQRARVRAPGVPLEAVTDPFALEVHKPITVDTGADLQLLPAYVPRRHDEELGVVVRRAAAGESGIAVLVAGSSTGKTRALWEALAPLRNGGGWRLWHPQSPTRSQALDELSRVRSRTIVWLNETQRYLVGDHGERAALALQTLLTDNTRSPVLVLGTLWPIHHDRLCRDPAAQTSKLLDGSVIEVPNAFTGAALEAMRRAATTDPRLAMAVERAEDDQVTQYLAGGPELVRHYRFSSSPVAKAVIEVAMDAVRMGHPNSLPYGLLRDAVPDYLTGVDRDGLTEDWLERALAETSEPCKGARGPVTRVNSLPAQGRRGRRNRSRTPNGGPAPAVVPTFVLADYLDQYGRTSRAETIPPIGFWEAAADHAYAGCLTALGHAAWHRGLYRDATQLWKNATGHGDIAAARQLLSLPLPGLQHTYRRQLLAWVAEHVAFSGSSDEAADMLVKLRFAGATDQSVDDFASRAAADFPIRDAEKVTGLLRGMWHASLTPQVSKLAHRAAADFPLDDARSVARLLKGLQGVGAAEQANALARRAVTGVPVDDEAAIAQLLDALQNADVTEQVIELAHRAATDLPLDDAHGVALLLDALQNAGATEQVAELARRAATNFPLDTPTSVDKWLQPGSTTAAQFIFAPVATATIAYVDNLIELLSGLWAVGATEQVAELAHRAATDFPLDNAHGVALLLNALQDAHATQQVAELAQDASANVAPDNAYGVALLLNALQDAGATEPAGRLAYRAATEISVDNAFGVSLLLNALRDAGATEQLAELARRTATNVTFDSAVGVSLVLNALQDAGATEQLAELARRTATDFPLDKVYGVTRLLSALQDAGLTEQVTELVRRAAVEVSLDNPHDLIELMHWLRAAGATEQFAELARRAATNAATFDYVYGATELLTALQDAGLTEQVAELARRAASEVPLDNPHHLIELMHWLWTAGATEQFAELARRAATYLSLDDVYGVTRLLSALQDTGATELITQLAHRAATEVPLDNPHNLIELIHGLRAAGATEQSTALAHRAANELTPNYGFASVVSELRAAGTSEQADQLARRVAAAGLFDEYMFVGNASGDLGFGHEPDASAAAAWSWDDLR